MTSILPFDELNALEADITAQFKESEVQTMRASENTIYSAFNIARAAAGKNPFTFRHGLADIAPGAYATAKQWSELGYRVERGCTGTKIYSIDEQERAHVYSVFGVNQVKRKRGGMEPEKLAELIAEVTIKGTEKAERARKKYGVVDPEEARRVLDAVEALYIEQQPERERRKNDRIAEQIKAREEENERKNQPPENGSDFVDADAASGGFLEIM